MKYRLLDNDKIVDEKHLRELLFEYELEDIFNNMEDYFNERYDLQAQFHMLEIAKHGEIDVVLYHLSNNWGVDADVCEY